MATDPLAVPTGDLAPGPLVLGVLVLSASLAGCADAGPADEGDAGDSRDETRLYEHRWTYGPSTYGRDELPRFEDAFDVPADVSQLRVTVEWGIEEGRAAVVLEAPDDVGRNLTDRDHGGPAGSGEASLGAVEGTWGFAIPTWRAEDGRFPEGTVRVVVTGR